MKYELFLDLFEDVDPETSYYEYESVGRLYMNLTKSNKPSRWRRLLKPTEKMPNMQLWWEMHEKHENSLLNHTTFETDEDAMENFIHYERPPKTKKPKKNKKKNEKESTY